MPDHPLDEACYLVIDTVPLRTLVAGLKEQCAGHLLRTVPEDRDGREQLYLFSRALDALVHEIATRADRYADEIGAPRPSEPTETDEVADRPLDY